MRLRALLLDIDGTLLDFARSEALAFTAAFAGEGLLVGDADYAAYRAINNALWSDFEQGRVTQDFLTVERFRRFLARRGSDIDPAAMNEVYLHTLSFTAVPMPGAVDMLEALAGRIPMAVVSNGTAAAQRGRIQAAGMARFFEHLFISGEMGVQKPDPAFFARVLTALGGPDPAEVLIVGDSLSADMRGGIGSGLKTCWFNPAGAENALQLPVDFVIDTLGKLPPLILERLG